MGKAPVEIGFGRLNEGFNMGLKEMIGFGKHLKLNFAPFLRARE